jgi:hypothetical protein
VHGAAPTALGILIAIDSQPCRAGLKFGSRPSGPWRFEGSAVPSGSHADTGARTCSHLSSCPFMAFCLAPEPAKAPNGQSAWLYSDVLSFVPLHLPGKEVAHPPGGPKLN